MVVLTGAMAGLTWFLWPRHPNDPILHLRIIRQTLENGRPVVFFQAEGRDRRRFSLGEVARVIGHRTEVPLDSDYIWKPGGSLQQGILRPWS